MNLNRYLLLRREGPPVRHPLWREICTTDAVDPEHAFKKVVLDFDAETVQPGEYMILPLEGAWHVGADIMLRDLTPRDEDTGQ